MKINEFTPVFERLWRYFMGKEEPNATAALSYFNGLDCANIRDFEAACDYLIRSKRPDKFQFPTPAEMADQIVLEMSRRDRREMEKGMENIISGKGSDPEHARKCADAIEFGKNGKPGLKQRRARLNGRPEPKYYTIFDRIASNYRKRAGEVNHEERT